MDDDIRRKLRYLRLSQLEEQWEGLLAEGVEMSPPFFLNHVVSVLYESRMQRASAARLKSAKIPDPFIMATYPFSQQPKLNKRKILSIHDSLDYMTKQQNIILVGPTGVGKTGIGTSFLINAITAGHRGLFITFPELIGDLYRSVAAHKEERTLKKYSRYACLHIDELGYVDVEPAQVGLFFRLMTMRHRTKTTIITSNLGFQEWVVFLKHPQLTAALLDRLTENSHVINMRNCVSLRAKAANAEIVNNAVDSDQVVPVSTHAVTDKTAKRSGGSTGSAEDLNMSSSGKAESVSRNSSAPMITVLDEGVDL
jgi:DNA replication protein DnaC